MIQIEIFGVPYLKKGKGIHIKKKNRGKFTEYCGGEVTNECILKAKKSKNPTLRKRAIFALNARSWSKKHQEGGPIKKHFTEDLVEEGFSEAPRESTFVKPYTENIFIERPKSQQPIDDRSDALKNYIKVFNEVGGKDLTQRISAARIKEADKYYIPYIPEKQIRLTAGRYNTGKISTNLLDSIYNASQRTGVPFDIALGLAGRESTLGIGRGFKKGSAISGTNLYSNWLLIQDIINTNSLVNRANALFARIKNKETLTDDEYNYLTEYLKREKRELDSTKPMKENPIDNALKYYISGKYNPGDKKHTLMVEEDARILMTDPAIQKWMKEKGIL